MPKNKTKRKKKLHQTISIAADLVYIDFKINHLTRLTPSLVFSPLIVKRKEIITFNQQNKRNGKILNRFLCAIFID